MFGFPQLPSWVSTSFPCWKPQLALTVGFVSGLHVWAILAVSWPQAPQQNLSSLVHCTP
ncbi:hypothetical protein VFPPC_18014 [Pochonia chlamydosporia 170]|uniref:Uncharacterized protein n=1 Tax=Pochonia chlamydosporia 170 TaxID=1380566 RepID=A0A219AQ58_METCM|nr:hypothetical protein VFPPC_18014 [Pochonia chlamydosporia 170]OWT42759.1 hypothetical protein VFPPC_18014 [Pochonia chlamydosporia 170]